MDRWCLYSRGCVALLLFVTAAVRGQEARSVSVSPEDREMDTLRTRTPTSRDDAIIDKWFGKKVDNLNASASDPLKCLAATNACVKCCNDQYHNPENSAAFKQRFVQRMSIIFGAEFRKRDELDPLVARAMARSLGNTRSIHARPGALDGLSFDDQVVRYLLVRLLASIRAEVTLDDRMTAATLDTISERCRNEVNGVVASVVYDALAYDGHPSDAVAAVLKVFDGRLDLLRNADAPLNRAELAAVRFLDAVTLGSESAKAQVVRRLAVLLRIHVNRYGRQGITHDEQAAIAETIFETESLLHKLVGLSASSLSIRDKMQKGTETAGLDMEIELIQWIGEAQTDGRLSGSPWNVPRGAP